MASNLFIVALSVGLVQALILAAALVSRDRHSAADKLLAVLLILLAVDLAYGVLMVERILLDVPHLARLRTPLTFLYGPLLFLYISLATSGRKLVRLDIAHGAIAVAIGLYFLPLFFAPAAEKIAYLSGLYEGLGAESRVIGGIRRVQQGAYVLAAGRCIWLIGKHPARAWLAFLVGGFGMIWLAGVYRYAFDFTLLAGQLDLSLLAIYVIVAGFLAIRKPIWIRPEAGSDSSLRRTAKSEEALARLEAVMRRDAPHRSKTLSLSDLAATISVRPDELSAILNSGLGESFSDYVNRHRIGDAMRLLRSEEGQTLKLATVAGDCGFNSTSTFNAAFRRLSGVTPSHFRDADEKTASEIMIPVIKPGDGA